MPVVEDCGIIESSNLYVIADWGTGTRGQCARSIGQHQSVLALLRMIEVIEDAELFHNARNEVEGSFTILHAILERGVSGGQAETEICEAKQFENLAEYVRRGHVLEYPAIGLAGEEPKPGHDLGMITG